MSEQSARVSAEPNTSQWAIIRAREELAQKAEVVGLTSLADDYRKGANDQGVPVLVLASYIAKHEQPPADPWEVAVRAAIGDFSQETIRRCADDIRTSLKSQGIEI